MRMRSIGHLPNGLRAYIVNESHMVETDLPTTTQIDHHFREFRIRITERDGNGEFTTGSRVYEFYARFRQDDEDPMVIHGRVPDAGVHARLRVWKSNPTRTILAAIL